MRINQSEILLFIIGLIIGKTLDEWIKNDRKKLNNQQNEIHNI